MPDVCRCRTVGPARVERTLTRRCRGALDRLVTVFRVIAAASAGTSNAGEWVSRIRATAPRSDRSHGSRRPALAHRRPAQTVRLQVPSGHARPDPGLAEAREARPSGPCRAPRPPPCHPRPLTSRCIVGAAPKSPAFQLKHSPPQPLQSSGFQTAVTRSHAVFPAPFRPRKRPANSACGAQTTPNPFIAQHFRWCHRRTPKPRGRRTAPGRAPMTADSSARRTACARRGPSSMGSFSRAETSPWPTFRTSRASLAGDLFELCNTARDEAHLPDGRFEAAIVPDPLGAESSRRTMNPDARSWSCQYPASIRYGTGRKAAGRRGTDTLTHAQEYSRGGTPRPVRERVPAHLKPAARKGSGVRIPPPPLVVSSNYEGMSPTRAVPAGRTKNAGPQPSVSMRG